MSGKRLKILIIAHEFSPFSGSECAVGWNFATRLANYHDVTLIYASGSQASPGSYLTSLNKYFAHNPAIPGMTLKNVNQPPLTRFTSFLNSFFKKIGPVGLPFLYYMGYNFWQRKAYKVAVTLHKQEGFHLVHQLTQISFREPGYTWKMKIPFFWGPTGGTANLPWKFYSALSFSSKLIEGMRFVSNLYQSHLVSRINKAMQKASVIYTYSSEDASYFRKRTSGHIKTMLDVGTLKHENINKRDYSKIQVLTGIWCGHLTYRKAPWILLNALAQSNITRERVLIKIIGNGPLEQKMHELAVNLNLKNIEWIRQVPHQEVFRIMSRADFLIHTSLREATSSVIPEALSLGLPVICHNANGMSFAVDETCGIRVPLISPEESEKGFHEAIQRLITDRDLLARLREGAQKRASEISWDNMANTIAVDYLNTVLITAEGTNGTKE